EGKAHGVQYRIILLRERCVVGFFFSSRRRHTRSYGDWSSDVCSSDLETFFWNAVNWGQWSLVHGKTAAVRQGVAGKIRDSARSKIGRASCRERVWVSVVEVALK